MIIITFVEVVKNNTRRYMINFQRKSLLYLEPENIFRHIRKMYLSFISASGILVPTHNARSVNHYTVKHILLLGKP